MELHERLAALESSPVPTWVFDADYFRQRWANPAALELWRAKSREELYARDYSDMSASTRARMQGYKEVFKAGRSAEEEWTLYPKGQPQTMKLFLSGVMLDDNRIGVLIQAFAKEQGPSADLVRSIEALRHTSVMVTLLDVEGKIVLQNPAATRAFGAEPVFRERFGSDDVADAIVSTAIAGEVFTLETAVKTTTGEQWHAIEARTLVDPATGKTAVLVQHTDESARVKAERRAADEGRAAAELLATLNLVERQKAEILALSAPVLEVGVKTIALPIIGSLDPQRAAMLEENMLSAVSARGTRTVIMDLTGADAMTTAETAEQVARLARAIRLLGARTIVTGIQTALARTLVTAGVDMGHVTLLRTLRDGIDLARRQER